MTAALATNVLAWVISHLLVLKVSIRKSPSPAKPLSMGSVPQKKKRQPRPCLGSRLDVIRPSKRREKLP
jgi:hypothetical protein